MTTTEQTGAAMSKPGTHIPRHEDLPHLDEAVLTLTLQEAAMLADLLEDPTTWVERWTADDPDSPTESELAMEQFREDLLNRLIDVLAHKFIPTPSR